MLSLSRFQKNGLAALIIILLLIGALVWIWHEKKPSPQVACTEEAKICPDGSTVGRTGPNCDFAPCPTAAAPDDRSGWKTTTDPALHLSFQYPAILPTIYIHTVDWPPRLGRVNEPWGCEAAGSVTAQAGKTEARTIHGHPYCVTTETEGAAGSIYSQYAYAFPRENGEIILTFSLRFVQCGNYDPTEQAACDKERNTFDLDALIDQMVGTLKPL